jgi:hypothetical protein
MYKNAAGKEEQSAAAGAGNLHLYGLTIISGLNQVERLFYMCIILYWISFI